MDNQLKKAVIQAYKKSFSNKAITPGKSIIPVSGKVFDEKEMLLMVEAVLDGWWTESHFCEEFEGKLAKFIGKKYCSTVNSGSSANLLAISALKSFRLKNRLKDGDEVITVAAGFPTTINAIIQNNLVPVFIDIDIPSYNVNFEELEKAISKKTKAIFIAHTLGNPFEIEKVAQLAKKKKLWLIEDNCDALGSERNDKKTGSFGHLATLSFYPAHHITTAEGGAVLTDDPVLNKIVRSLRDWGRDCWCKTGFDNSCKNRFSWKLGKLPYGYDHKYIYSEIGYNLKMTDIQGALGVAQMEKLEDFIQKRKDNFRKLSKIFSQWSHFFILPVEEAGSSASWFGFPLTIKDKRIKRKELLEFLSKNNIGNRLIFGGNILKQPYFCNYKIKYRVFGKLKNTEKIMNDSFWIGLYPGINDEKIEYVKQIFTEFLKRYDS